MSAIDVIKALEATSSRTDKEQVLMNAFMTGERQFFEGAKMAYDILVTYGVKKVPEILEEDDGEPGTFSYDDFLSLAEKLRRRELTGHAARDAMLAAADECNITLWNTFYRRVLLKDLKCGAETSTINKVLKKLSDSEPEAKELIIPVFSCQLAQDGAKPEHEKKVKGRKMLDIKLDGVRLLAILDKDAGTVTLYTRNGKINENFPEIQASLARLMQALPGSVVLDGEVVASSFQELMTQVNRRSDVDTSSAKLAVFDIVPLSAFRAGVCDIPQEMRHIILSNMETTGQFKEHTDGLVYAIPKVTVELDTPEGQATFAEFNRQAIEAGYEGIMVNDPEAPYELRRSFAWLKIKPFIEVTLKIVGFYEGEPGSKYVGMLGGLEMEGEDDGRPIKVNVGGGFSDKERKEIWDNQADWLGIMGEVRADALTLERGSTVYSLRFPRWKGRRGFVPGEKI